MGSDLHDLQTRPLDDDPTGNFYVDWFNRDGYTILLGGDMASRATFAFDLVSRAWHKDRWPDGSTNLLLAETPSVWVSAVTSFHTLAQEANRFRIPGRAIRFCGDRKSLQSSNLAPHGRGGFGVGSTPHCDLGDDRNYDELSGLVAESNPAFVFLDIPGLLTRENLASVGNQNEQPLFIRRLDRLSRNTKVVLLCPMQGLFNREFLADRPASLSLEAVDEGLVKLGRHGHYCPSNFQNEPSTDITTNFRTEPMNHYLEYKLGDHGVVSRLSTEVTP